MLSVYRGFGAERGALNATDEDREYGERVTMRAVERDMSSGDIICVSEDGLLLPYHDLDVGLLLTTAKYEGTSATLVHRSVAPLPYLHYAHYRSHVQELFHSDSGSDSEEYSEVNDSELDEDPHYACAFNVPECTVDNMCLFCCEETEEEEEDENTLYAEMYSHESTEEEPEEEEDSLAAYQRLYEETYADEDSDSSALWDEVVETELPAPETATLVERAIEDTLPDGDGVGYGTLYPKVGRRVLFFTSGLTALLFAASTMLRRD